MSSPTYVTQNEYPLDDDTTLMSTTDIHSYITHANDTFVQVSGYPLDELTGQPHNMVRHPDMPKAAYKDLWDTAAAGQKWHGYVKNLCKDGSHYWVYATVVPNIRRGETVGYTSVRRKPSRSKIEAAMAQYAQMNQNEEG